MLFLVLRFFRNKWVYNISFNTEYKIQFICRIFIILNKAFFRIYPLYLMVLALYVSLYYYNYYTGEFSLGHLSIENIIQSVFISSYQSDVISPIYGWGARCCVDIEI